MYCDYFGLSREPFSIAPDPAFLYPSNQHRQALAHLRYGIEREGGFLLLTGEVGTGKTTLVRLLIEQVPASFRIAYVLNATLDRLDILASICEELGVEVRGVQPTAKAYVDALNVNLLHAHAEGRKTLVIIEEAQNLSAESLEMLRLLTNLETNTTKLLHILLVGQPELLDTIAQPGLRQLNQRILVRFHLDPLDRRETEHYLRHRLHKAGCSRALFEPGAIRTLHDLGDGVPRKLNLIAERALLGAYAENRDRVGRRQVVRAEREVFGAHQRHAAGKWPRYSIPLSVIMIGIMVFLAWQLQLSNWRPVSVANMNTTGGEHRVEGVTPTMPEESGPVNPGTEETASLMPVHSTPFAGLLALWSVSWPADSVAQMCRGATAEGLYCVEDSYDSVSELMAMNRPGVVELESAPFLLTRVQNALFYLQHGDQAQVLSEEEFREQWTGEVAFLWRPPPGYSDSLRVGDRNTAVVTWLMARLQSIDPAQPELITGGSYSQALAQSVTSFQREQGLVTDGVLGQQTIMKLNELDGSVPLLGGSMN